MLIFDKLPLWRQVLSFAGINVGRLPELLLSEAWI